MATRVARHAWTWALAGLALVVLLWLLGDILLPFVLGAMLAYFLNPLVDGLVRRGMPRAGAVALIAVVALALITLALIAPIPALISQAGALVAAAPDLFQALARALTERFPDLTLDSEALRGALTQVGTWAQERGGELVNGLVTSARSLLGVVLLLVVVPVVTVYLLVDWHRLVAAVDDLLPRAQAPTIRDLARQIDRAISAYIRGMGSVCLAMAVYYALGLMAVGLNFGLVVGALAGLLTFIPYVGAAVGGALAIGLALYQFWGDWLSFGLVVAVFVGGQVLEGNVITPRIVGQAVGLHPVWLLFALSVMGALFGLVGMLVAVPLAAAAGVLVRHAVIVYRQSDLYRGA